MLYGNEIRRHYYLPKTVIVAPRRSARPTSFTESITVANQAACVLCNSHEECMYSVQSSDGWVIKSVRNPYGALTEHQKHAYGYQEVIIESPAHITNFSDHSVYTIKMLLDTYAHRSDALKKRPHIRYVSVFKNNGPHAGATLQHSHSQVFGFPFVPEKVLTEVEALAHYKQKHGNCAICDVIRTELTDNVRVAYELDHAIALCPFASEYPYELLIIPKKHSSSLSKLHDDTKYDMATLLKMSIHMLDMQKLDYNYYINDMHHAGTHTYIRITPRIGAPKVFGGLEMATDITVNSVPPERAAKEYRQHVGSLLPAQHYAIAK
ncbi:MAG TPA: DUF4931 domain-containing protein [Candidatus Saccharibacteria bacterium]|nr:DUF4931 domain-containing protein [Candidatus Nomurabacteria bacterium]HPR10663.1 DUF4931 domain-containing protein [Candidatus Saccharibacteria bacterium]